MDHLLDETLADAAELDAHLAKCTRCRAELARLRQVRVTVRQSVRHQADEARLERATAKARAAIEAQAPGPSRVRRPVGRVLPALGALLLAFALGVGAGRTAYPREVMVPRVVTRTEVVEKRVDVPVEIIRERVVVKRVPVVNTKIVYRDRGMTTAEPGPPWSDTETVLALPPNAEATSEPIATGGPALPGDATVMLVRPVISREIHPVTVAGTPPSESEDDEYGSRTPPGARGLRTAKDVTLARGTAIPDWAPRKGDDQ